MPTGAVQGGRCVSGWVMFFKLKINPTQKVSPGVNYPLRQITTVFSAWQVLSREERKKEKFHGPLIGGLTSPFSLLISFTALYFFFFSSLSRSLNFFFFSSRSFPLSLSLLDCSAGGEEKRQRSSTRQPRLSNRLQVNSPSTPAAFIPFLLQLSSCVCRKKKISFYSYLKDFQQNSNYPSSASKTRSFSFSLAKKIEPHH